MTKLTQICSFIAGVRWRDPFQEMVFDTIVENCLKKVDESDLFILYIADQAGSYLQQDDATVTHIEMLHAYNQKKSMIVFVDDSIHELFFHKNVYRNIQAAMDTYQQENGCEANSVYTLVKELKGLPQNVDVYTWVLLYDIVRKGIYWEQLHRGVGLTEKLTHYLSNRLKTGLSLLPDQKQIIRNAILAEEYGEFQDLVIEVMPLFHTITIQQQDWQTFLTILREKLKGAQIVKETPYRQEVLGSFGNCTGIALYKREETIMRRIERDGRAQGEAFYELTEKDKFVVDAMLKPHEEGLYYREDKRTVYFTTKIGQYVLSAHFKLDRSWSKTRVMTFQKEIISAILKTNRMYVLFVKLALGGMR